MILVADSGSTKCDWALLNKKGECVTFSSQGLNPILLSDSSLRERIDYGKIFLNKNNEIKALYFYGADCGNKTSTETLETIFSEYLPNAKLYFKEDIEGAVRAVATTPSIVCILGTGSNSCFFDGKKSVQKLDSLGYLLMDEASGNYFGKQLLRDYFYKKMPQNVSTLFEKTFILDPEELKINLYKKENANAYLASFATFIKNKEIALPYFNKMLEKGIQDFVNLRIKCFEEAKDVPIHFVGSLSKFAAQEIKKVLQKNKLTLGKIMQKPIEGLIVFHRNKIEI